MRVLWLRRLTSVLAALMCAHALWAGEVLPLLKTGTETYENVTVVDRSATHVVLQHSRGIANIRIDALDPETQKALGLGSSNNVASVTAVPAKSREASEKEASVAKARRELAANMVEMFTRMLEDIRQALPANVAAAFGLLIAGTLAVLVLLYLFQSYCLRLICLKAGYKPGLLAWVPILRLIPLIRAAGMSAVWFLVLYSPGILSGVVKGRFPGYQQVVMGACIVALIVHCIWCVRICRARGKGALAIIFLIFPLTYPFAMLYLAFADRLEVEDAPAKSVRDQAVAAW